MGRGHPRLSLLEAGVLFALVTTVVAVFTPTFWQRLRSNKIAEAPELLEELHHRAASYYATDWGGGHRRCLPESAGPTPAKPTVDAELVDFTAEGRTGRRTWEALDFRPARPIRFSYRYESRQHGCGLAGDGKTAVITLSAEGDLDGDELKSRFERNATLTPDGSLVPLGGLQVHRRVE